MRKRDIVKSGVGSGVWSGVELTVSITDNVVVNIEILGAATASSCLECTETRPAKLWLGPTTGSEAERQTHQSTPAATTQL
jgi:hypothetical protein